MITRHVEHIMGIPVSLALRGPSERHVSARAAWQAVISELRHVDEVFSTYREDSWISRLDRGEVSEQDCPIEVSEVIDLGERAQWESDGAFDIRYDDSLDPSGVVKGWAVERASRLLYHLDLDYLSLIHI